ncbi:MAG TPA: hypothetical protein VGD77_02510 [Gemmatimonadaceae bacterium]
MPKPISRARKTTAASNAVGQSRALSLVRPSSPEPLRCDSLEFDVEDDIASIIPMPASIAVPIRSAISRELARRFEFADDLDGWLHAAHDRLGGATPFECVVAGDGLGVLGALLDGADGIPSEVAETLAQHSTPVLKLVT